ncbi:DNA polymerase [Trifolium medium]|uniref:DNA-directed DNA polymerase n=1 Tax=Trifolium medium TaxID=97028 RepID=A0A392MUT5_9FABA|nr:DNA polymerase [Trifolium medium]
MICGIFIRIYLSDRKPDEGLSLTNDEVASKLWGCFNSHVVVEHKEPRRVGSKKGKFKKYITSIKLTEMQRQPFIVADTETVIIDSAHVPYAIGFLVVNPGDDLLSEDKGFNMIETYFSESYHYQIFPSIHDRSNRMLSDFIARLVVVVRQHTLVRTVYFHNFSRFDGIMLLRHLVINGKMYRIKPLMRNNMLYEIAVYLDNKLVFNLRDSLTLLTSPLNTLAKHLCPQLGSKGSIPYDEISVDNLITLKSQLIEYMKQDILLLGGVMLKAQDIYWKLYKIDIVTKLTLSSLALAIFRTKYYDSEKWPIYIPTRNEDALIRRGYYGGHADVYIPKGENLYYYDVNSLYPYIMKSFNVPGGKSVGVYYSEELKYARKLGYQITPLSGNKPKQTNDEKVSWYVC